MATQEERLTQVEQELNQFKTDTIRSYQNMALEVTWIKGLTEDTVKRLMLVDHRFNLVDQQLKDLHNKSDEQTVLLTKILAQLQEKS
jgi:hypothetical protein